MLPTAPMSFAECFLFISCLHRLCLTQNANPSSVELGQVVKVCYIWTNGAPRQKFRKGDRSRRMWIAREEEILATCLLDLVARGWKSDNGFRAGRATAVSGKSYQGLALDSTPMAIIGSIAMMSNGSKLSRRTSMPRACGINPSQYGRHGRPFLEWIGQVEVGLNRLTRLLKNCVDDQPQNQPRSVVGQKRKAASADDALIDFLAKLLAETNSRLDVMSSRIGYEFDLGKARQEVFDKLGTVDRLTLKEKYELCNIMSVKKQFLEVFMGMPAHARLGYVTMLLEQNRDGN
ncbi:hypothetical protein SASPL_117360 [Salvia splendens]|uniref:Uncharacterized protein n=1 Tax=Salvia splendens TaxID=180675 RepID=A0A8X8ZY31_SALSN|nr:hypothetical protein SASPL_117360 [Salvia splendens]